MKDHRTKNVSFFADQDVGFNALKFVLDHYPTHVQNVVTITENDITKLARSFGCRTILYEEITEQNAELYFEQIDLIFLAWWPRIIPNFIINAPKIGAVNFHPSFLPYNRGKNYNFWTIVENTPFGVTLHFVDEGIDSGDILFQSPIFKTWEDTGGTLYLKAKSEMLSLFQDHYLDIVSGQYTRIKQDTTFGGTHYAKELDAASQLYLDRKYELQELLNLLRARTFEGKPTCFFWDNGKKFEVRVTINEVDHETD